MRPIYLISQTPCAGVIHIPILTIHFLTPNIDFSAYCGLVFTSKQAIKSLEQYPQGWKSLPCVCVSEATAAAAREAGAMDIRAAEGYGKSIPDLLASQPNKGKWLYLRPKVVASEWVETARGKGIQIDETIMYETLCNDEETFPIIDQNAILIFTSPSSIECFLRRYLILPSHKVVAIGKTTQEALPMEIESTISESTSVASCLKIARELAIL